MTDSEDQHVDRARPGRADAWAPVVGHVRSPDFRRVSHGLFLRVRDGSTSAAEWFRDLGAWLEVLPASAVFTGLTAARLAGWWCPPLPAWAPVFVTVEPGGPCPQRAGLVVSRYRRGAEHVTTHLYGLPVERPGEVLLRCARDLDVLDMVPLVESALRTRAVTRGELAAVCETRRPGVRVLRRSLALAETRSESPWETVLRLFLQIMEVDVEAQPDILDGEGRFVARADLRVRGTNLLFEYDGATHRARDAQEVDLRRQRKLLEVGQERRGYTRDDLVRHPAAVMGEVDRVLGRDTDLSRLHLWRTLLDRSCHTETGRHRLRSRWAVGMDAFIAG